MSTIQSSIGGALGKMGLRFEPAPPRPVPPAGLRIAVVVLGLVIGGAFLAAQPGVGTSLFHRVWISTFGTPLGISQLAQLTTPLLLAGAAVAVGGRAGVWNIGVEGQLFMGAWLGTAIAFYLPKVWTPLFITLVLLGSFVGGALWALIPALARAYWNVSEIVTTLMFNFIASYWIVYWTTGPWSANELLGSGSISSKLLDPDLSLPQLSIGSITLGTGFLISLAVLVAVAGMFRYTVYGFRVDITGIDEATSIYAGMNNRRLMVSAFLISGGIGGLAGGIVELDQIHSLSAALSHNTGYIGIVVAVLAMNSLLLCVPMAVLMAFLAAAGVALQLSGVSFNAVLFLTGFVMLLAASCGPLGRYRIVRARPGNQPRSLDSDPTPPAAASSDEQERQATQARVSQ